jgi:hypothetical protein
MTVLRYCHDDAGATTPSGPLYSSRLALSIWMINVTTLVIIDLNRPLFVQTASSTKAR